MALFISMVLFLSLFNSYLLFVSLFVGDTEIIGVRLRQSDTALIIEGERNKVMDCHFQFNGVAISSLFSNFILSNSIFLNTARISLDIYDYSSIIQDCLFESSGVTPMPDSFIVNSHSSNLSILHSIFQFNSNTAINVEGGEVDVRGTLIRGNNALIASIVISSSNSATFNNCNITNNNGNGAFANFYSKLYFNNCNISENAIGGSSSGGITSFHRCNFINNTFQHNHQLPLLLKVTLLEIMQLRLEEECLLKEGISL